MTKKEFNARLNTYEEIIELKEVSALRKILAVNQAYNIVEVFDNYIVFTGSRYPEGRRYAISTENKELVQELLNPIMSTTTKKES